MSTQRRRQSQHVATVADVLEPRIVLSTSATEAYAWSVVDLMRSNPAQFANQLEGMYRSSIEQAHGYQVNDPIWTDLRNNIDDGKNPDHFWQALDLMRSQGPLGPLALMEPLETISQEHNDWMETHCYAHSYYDSPGTAFPVCHDFLPDRIQEDNGPWDIINREELGGWSTGAWAENIGFTTGNSLPATRAEFGAGSSAHLQRQAYDDIIGFIVEVNSDSLGHLRNLLARDRYSSGGFNLAPKSKNKDIKALNAIGIDYDNFNRFGSNQTNWLATHTLSQHEQTRGEGGYISLLVYEDLNGNGHYDRLEGKEVSWLITQHFPDGSAIGHGFATNQLSHGVISDFQHYNGMYTVSASAGGREIGTQAVIIQDNNVRVTFRVSNGFGLTGGTTPTLAPDLYESGDGNDTRQSAFEIGEISPANPLGTRTDVLSIHDDQDEDWFAFDVVGRDAVIDFQVGFEHDNGDIDMRLYQEAADGTLALLQSSISETDNERIERTVSPGRYLFRMYGYSGAENFYSLTADGFSVLTADVVADRLADATVVVPGADGQVTFTSALEPNDIDLFRVDVDQATPLYVTTAFPPHEYVVEADTVLRLFDSSGNEIAFDDDSGAGLYSALELQVEPGIYYVGVSGYGSDEYEPITGTGADSDSIGDYSLRIAVPAFVSVPSTTPGVIEADGGADYMTFVAAAGASYQFEVILGTLDDSVLTLFDTNGTSELRSDDDGGPGLASLINWTAPADGMYFLQVSGYRSSVGGYVLDISVINDHGSDAGSARPVSIPSSTTGIIENHDGSDFFSINATAGQELDFETDVGTLIDTTLTLYDRDGTTQLEFDDDGGHDLASRIQWSVPASGTYFIKVAGYDSHTGGYTLNIRSNSISEDSIVGRMSDGRVWIAVSDGTSFSNQLWATLPAGTNWQNLQVGDFTGDGKEDLAARDDEGDWWAWTAGDDSFTAAEWGGRWSTGVTWSNVMTGDLNGDGLTDIAGRAQNGAWYIAESTGSGFTTKFIGAWSTNVTWTDINVGDFNGDGTDDIVGRASSGTWVILQSTGSGSHHTNLVAGAWSTGVTWHDVRVGDFDNDGDDDVIGRASTGSWYVAFSDGSGFTNVFARSWSTNVTWHDVTVGDFNGDGRADVAGRSSNGTWYILRPTGGSGGSTTFSTLYAGLWSTNVTWLNVVAGDFNGDGLTDIAGRASSGSWYVARSTGVGFANERWGSWSPAVTWQDVRRIRVS